MDPTEKRPRGAPPKPVSEKVGPRRYAALTPAEAARLDAVTARGVTVREVLMAGVDALTVMDEIRRELRHAIEGGDDGLHVRRAAALAGEITSTS